MSEAKTYKVSIAGIPLKLKSSHNDETVEQILRMVDEKLDKKVCQNSVQSAAILACLRLAEELYHVKKQTDDELGRLEDIAQSFISEIQEIPL